MHEYRKKLKKNGFKITPGREAILAFFSGENRYVTPETVWKEVKKYLPRLGLPTVYRNLKQMRKIDILTQVDGAENRFYFGLCRAKNPGKHHHHISCQKCHRVNEVENCYFESLTEEIKKKTGFLITGHKFQLTGVCKNCQSGITTPHPFPLPGGEREKENMAKKLTLCFLIILFALSPLSHGRSYGENNTREKGSIRILASFYPVYITTLNVTKNVPGVAVTNLTPPLTGCLHDYALTTNDMKKFAGADIFVANGAGMESFLDRIIKRYPAVKVMQLSQGIPLIKGADDKSDNPHVWVSISNAIIQVENLSDALQAIDPVHKNLYQKNTDGYVAQLETLRRKMHTALKPYQGEKIVTFHEAFPYFAREFGLEIAAVVEREPGSQPNARELAETIALVKRSKIKALFAEPQYPALAAGTIARETGANVYLLDPVVTGPEQPDAYLRIMEKNLATLEKALK